MASTLLPADESLLPEDVRFTVESDITHLGTLGAARLVVTGDRAIRYERTPLGDDVLGEWPLAELTEPRVEDLVGAVALVANRGSSVVELLRTSSSKSLTLAGAEKRLKAIMAGEPAPEVDDAPRLCRKCGRPLPEDTDICSACLNRGKTALRLFAYAKPYKARLVAGVALTLGGTILELAPPYVTKLLVDEVLTQRKTHLFLPLILGLIASRFLITMVQIARGRNVAFLGAQIAIAIRSSLFRKFQTLSLSFYDKRNVGSIMSRMTNDTTALYDVLVDGIPVLLNQGALLIGIPIAMFIMDWRIAIWALAPVPIVLLAVRWFRKKMVRVWGRYWHAQSRLSGALNGVLQGARVVKAFHGENREVDRFGRRIKDLAHLGYTAENHWSTFFPMVMFTMSLSGFMIWWVGGNAVLEGSLSLGLLTAFIGYMAMLQQPLMMLQRIVDWTSRSLTAAERVFEVIDTPIDVEEKPDAVSIEPVKGAILFRDVHFGYDKAREVIHGVDLEVAPGEMIGLVGQSGAGKSTLINLLLRFYDPTQGVVSIDGVDLRSVKIDELRRNVGVVLQESYLFPGSIKDNIAYGRPDAGLEEVMEAAKAANAHDFIVHFPDGYDSYVGERGQRLSGGERQRIAIARAILHNPKILVLDEATSSVDTETERLIQEALERLVEGRTTIAIAHRLSTLRHADRIVVMKEGKIAEVGTHDELLNRDQGIYAKLVQMQQEMQRVRGGFLGETEDDVEPPKDLSQYAQEEA